MKKIVPLIKEINFNTNIAEITAIALDHNLELNESRVIGNLIVSGSYKMSDASFNVEEFNHSIPVSIEINDTYDLDNLKINIEDFYYEIVDNKFLSVSIDIGLDGLVDKPLPIIENINDKIPEIEEVRIDTTEVKTLFNSFDDSVETYSTYKVYIVKENDSIENICLNYKTTKECIEMYNDLSDLKMGDKLIIPSLLNEID